jgi:hypothetical protein
LLKEQPLSVGKLPRHSLEACFELASIFGHASIYVHFSRLARFGSKADIVIATWVGVTSHKPQITYRGAAVGCWKHPPRLEATRLD